MDSHKPCSETGASAPQTSACTPATAGDLQAGGECEILPGAGRAGRDGALCPGCQSDGKQGQRWIRGGMQQPSANSPWGPQFCCPQATAGAGELGGASPQDQGLWTQAEAPHAPAAGRKRSEEQKKGETDISATVFCLHGMHSPGSPA